MDWNTLASALIGGLLGGGLSGVVAYMSLRNDRAEARRGRQWVDAEIAANTRQLLKDIDPARRGINLNRTPGVEDQRWETLRQRSEETYNQLVSAGASRGAWAGQDAGRASALGRAAG